MTEPLDEKSYKISLNGNRHFLKKYLMQYISNKSKSNKILKEQIYKQLPALSYGNSPALFSFRFLTKRHVREIPSFYFWPVTGCNGRDFRLVLLSILHASECDMSRISHDKTEKLTISTTKL